MSVKYHKTPNGKISVCKAKVRRCIYELVTADGVPVVSSPTTSQNVAEKNAEIKPVITLNNYVNQSMLPDVDYDYEGYGCYGCYGCETGNDYCRGRSYSGLHVTGLDADKILDQYFTRNGETRYPDKFYEILEKSGILEEDNWEVSTSPGYYGDEIDPPVFLKDNPLPEIINLYKEEQTKKLEPFNDSEGYISYLRDLGYKPTPGVSYEQAVKEHVLNKILPPGVKQTVQNAKTVTHVNWRLLHSMFHASNKLEDKARVSRKRLTQEYKDFLTKIRVDDPKNEAPSELPEQTSVQDKAPIVGILVKNKTNNRYRLVEGLGMYKTLLAKSNDFYTTFPKPELANYRFIVIQ